MDGLKGAEGLEQGKQREEGEEERRNIRKWSRTHVKSCMCKVFGCVNNFEEVKCG